MHYNGESRQLLVLKRKCAGFPEQIFNFSEFSGSSFIITVPKTTIIEIQMFKVRFIFEENRSIRIIKNF